ncbi:hypothetical protein VNO77_08140 [Canavalia gladiata]|uniref:Uncharacterized protein n=1 Tax=Canavalia gladiata TaxID=3824 RepID=A0AAN9QTN9_CANGL
MHSYINHRHGSLWCELPRGLIRDGHLHSWSTGFDLGKWRLRDHFVLSMHCVKPRQRAWLSWVQARHHSRRLVSEEAPYLLRCLKRFHFATMAKRHLLPILILRYL